MKPNTKYTRVIPRDLFNEAKLLKCMGLLCLKIHDRQTPVAMDLYDDQGDLNQFEIGLLDTGHLTLTSIRIYIGKKNFIFKTVYNSKENYPLFVDHNDCEYLVFDENGEWDQEFIQFVNSL